MGFNAILFGQRLRELRIDSGLSTIKLGKEIGFSSQTVSRWENGTRNPCVESLYIIAKYFGVDSDYLIGLKN